MEMAKATREKTLFPELRQWLEDTGQYQYDLARVLGVSTAQISRYLSGKQDITADRAVRLSLLTKIAPELLVSNPETARILKFLGKQSKPDAEKSNEASRVV